MALEHGSMEHAQIWQTLASLLANTAAQADDKFSVPQFHRRGNQTGLQGPRRDAFALGAVARSVVEEMRVPAPNTPF
jgi:hypothetical protein